MSRFFKSAAFPILIVVVLAFFAQKIIIGSGSTAPKQSYADFISQLQAGQVKTVDVKNKDDTIVVKLRDGQQYETGFPARQRRPGSRTRLDAAKAAEQAARTTMSRAPRATAGSRCSPTCCPS